MIAAIFAIDSKGGIGKNGSLPWPHNPEDMKWFRENTKGHTVVMGRKTWNDPLMPKPLFGRANVVVTNKPLDKEYEDTSTIAGNCADKVSEVASKASGDVFVIGGAEVIKSCAKIFDRIIITRFAGDYECDTFIDVDTLLAGFTLDSKRDSSGTSYEIWKKNT